MNEPGRSVQGDETGPEAARERASVRPLGVAGKPEIRVFGGLHEGAAWTLDPGSCLIGSADRCDVVLTDAGIAPEHLLVSVGEEGVCARPLARTRVRLEGRPLRPGAQVDLSADQVIDLGPVRLAFGDEQTDWNAISARLAPAWSLGAGGARASSGWLESVRRRPVAWGVAAFFGLATAVGVAVGAMSQRAPDPSTLTGGRLAGYAAKAVGNLGLAEVRIQQSGNNVSVTGYVPDQRSVQRVRESLAGTQARVGVFSTEELRRFLAELMSARGFRTDVTYDGAGRFVVAGKARQDAGFEQAVARLSDEVPGVVSARPAMTEIPMAQAASASPAPDDPMVLGGVNGINLNQRYMSSGSNYIFRGGVLQNGMTVVDIEPERVLVDDKGKNRRTQITVR